MLYIRGFLAYLPRALSTRFERLSARRCSCMCFSYMYDPFVSSVSVARNQQAPSLVAGTQPTLQRLSGSPPSRCDNYRRGRHLPRATTGSYTLTWAPAVPGASATRCRTPWRSLRTPNMRRYKQAYRSIVYPVCGRCCCSPACLNPLSSDASLGDHCCRSQIRDLNRGSFGFVQLAKRKDIEQGKELAIKFIERGDQVRTRRRRLSLPESAMRSISLVTWI